MFNTYRVILRARYTDTYPNPNTLYLYEHTRGRWVYIFIIIRLLQCCGGDDAHSIKNQLGRCFVKYFIRSSGAVCVNSCPYQGYIIYMATRT
jgi:hypothetical protein